MNEPLSPKEQAILEAIKLNIKTKGYPPSIREIGQVIGLKSSSTVHTYLCRLEEKGFIHRNPTKPRAIEVLDHHTHQLYAEETISVPLLGKVAAGQPLLAEENHDVMLQLPAGYFGNGDLFMLRVQGKSMIEAGIHPDDIVVVRKQPLANNGDIVVALLGDEATVKTFYKEKDCIRLQPENRQFKPIIAKQITILGKVVGLMRRY